MKVLAASFSRSRGLSLYEVVYQRQSDGTEKRGAVAAAKYSFFRQGNVYKYHRIGRQICNVGLVLKFRKFLSFLHFAGTEGCCSGRQSQRIALSWFTVRESHHHRDKNRLSQTSSPQLPFLAEFSIFKADSDEEKCKIFCISYFAAASKNSPLETQYFPRLFLATRNCL